MKTFVPKAETLTRKWYVLDAQNQVLGRLAAQVANLLMGKGKPTFVRYLDVGDFVIIINAEKVRLTGKKLDTKVYRHHTGYMGHLKEATVREMLDKRPEFVVRSAIEGMLPKNKLGKALAKKLKVYVGDQHPHSAQQPIPYPAT
jgi:large subunit ribosomal protein L13